jgi:stage V sporulation protein S
MGEETEEILRVSGATQPEKLGSTIARRVVEGRKVALRAVGAPAVNQATKAVIIASGMVASRGIVLSRRDGFIDVEMPDKTVTGILIRVLVE